MAKGDDIPKTDPAEIERLIERLKQSNLDPRDLNLVERALIIVSAMEPRSEDPVFSLLSDL
jgi:hypothetical protein